MPETTLTPCIPFQGVRNHNGYGHITVDQKTYRVHRWIWTQFHGEIPKGRQILHRCDVRHCINPKHLFLGTPMDNMRDMIQKGRAVHPPMKGIPQDHSRRKKCR